ncbi:MAG: SRPBCC family protein [Anaerolineales bacterium]
MMADILLMVPMAADPKSVYRALTTREGLASWWTEDVEAEPEVGAVNEFRFEGGQVVMRMKVAELAPPERVVWEVQIPAPPEWGSTKVTYDIKPTEEGVHLLFGHRGWASTEGSFPAINYNWAYYLTSLKEYVEEGAGFPHEA